jgi:hypothetical protein
MNRASSSARLSRRSSGPYHQPQCHCRKAQRAHATCERRAVANGLTFRSGRCCALSRQAPLHRCEMRRSNRFSSAQAIQGPAGEKNAPQSRVRVGSRSGREISAAGFHTLSLRWRDSTSALSRSGSGSSHRLPGPELPHTFPNTQTSCTYHVPQPRNPDNCPAQMHDLPQPLRRKRTGSL